MKRNLLAIFIIIVFITTVISGCFENNENIDIPVFKGITLESTIVELVYASKEFIEDDSGNICRIEVQFLVRNIAGRKISFNITAEFYDKDNNLLNTSYPPKEYIDIPTGWVESQTPFNTISYEGDDLIEVDHVIIKAIER